MDLLVRGRNVLLRVLLCFGQHGRARIDHRRIDLGIRHVCRACARAEGRQESKQHAGSQDKCEGSLRLAF